MRQTRSTSGRDSVHIRTGLGPHRHIGTGLGPHRDGSCSTPAGQLLHIGTGLGPHREGLGPHRDGTRPAFGRGCRPHQDRDSQRTAGSCTHVHGLHTRTWCM